MSADVERCLLETGGLFMLLKRVDSSTNSNGFFVFCILQDVETGGFLQHFCRKLGN